ncbi:inactive pancreatic lipase-related protein 1 [Drosophila mojavensis]|uniref:Lipase domain-containing protein n=1 Tax=Drosophila mojavensis TaxID=7230 RepID=A0A0Q9XDF7_DROMO|nr:inactive pancreatic lipase-related protein 1 [Drosophila mojavensis]KRG02542.1 uncharacterized protein Dmoj_GI25743 [Drosophila mojavensis]
MCKYRMNAAIPLICWLLLLWSSSVRLDTPRFQREPCVYATDECPNSRISFWLYTNSSRDAPVLLDALNLQASSFEPRLPLKILIHGFTGNRSLTPNAEVRDVLLQAQPVHVISVDYGSLVRFPCYYPWAVRNAPVVAKCLAQLIDSLLASGIYRREQLHLIGFSLGGQVAGLTANFVQEPLSRITGLDPAGPGFMTNRLSDKLDASDADFVDVIHTDPFFFSLLPAMGHADFYPNLDHFSQPGCTYINRWRPYNCNHFRAAIYYGESIVSEHGFWAQQCSDWMQYFTRRCSLHAHRLNTQMGYFVSENSSGSFFLSTNEKHPYAKGPISIIVPEISEF